MAEAREPGRRIAAERWIALVRIGAVAFAGVEIGLFTEDFPPGYERWAWAITIVFAAFALLFLVLSRARRERAWTGLTALAVDTVVISAYATLFAYEYGSPTRWGLIFVVVEAALLYGLLGGIVLPAVLLPFLVFAEEWRAERFDGPPFHADRVSFPFGILLLAGLIVGWLVSQLRSEAGRAQARADDAERLRDELGRRVDLSEAANRCARVLGSSLNLDEAFSAFVGELRVLVPFDRVAILLVDGDEARVMFVAGVGEDVYLPRGARFPVAGSVLDAVIAEGQTAHRPDMEERRFPEEEAMVALGLRARVIAPLQLGPTSIGAISIVRARPNSYRPEELELISLLGRLVANAVQNIRTYDTERATVDELRRLSSLRADFVSLVSHELRSPMAAVIGSARTLQARWRELRPDQREAFLAVIGDETARLAALIGDVLDTSRVDAGTFGYTFTEVDLAGVVRDAVSAAALGQDEVRLTTDLPPALPPVRGDEARLRQIVDNLVSNALKYSATGAEVHVLARARNGSVQVRVSDAGPGIPLGQQGLIFEKFGRASGQGAKPGTGLGLFLSRSFAEAHGGSLEVDSRPGEGATFTLTLPV
ncbi:MAG: GAF domain-containing protein [Actinobacteria bacterium]|nr:GAF domain-containing protein [Actinomycetota bacterium]